MQNIDLTTLPGWESLPSGTHNITIVAKADGYRDSEPSNAVSVEKAYPEPVEEGFITFTGESSDFTLTATNKEWNGTVEYSTDKTTWTTWDGTAISSSNQKLYLRGKGNTKFYTSNGAKFVLSARAGCSGNIQTLLDYGNPPTSIPADNCYRALFRECTNLTIAPELPATTLGQYCYRYMFKGCTGLKISTTVSGAYLSTWRIPSSGTISSTPYKWNTEMLSGTGGTFTSEPSANTTYYGAWFDVVTTPPNPDNSGGIGN